MSIICGCCGVSHARPSIVPARDDDYRAVRELLGAWQIRGFRREEIPHTLIMRLSSHRGDGPIIASITALPCPDDPHTLFLCRWKVHRMFRGQGIGRAMLEAALANARLRRRTRAYAVTHPGKAAAHIFETIGGQRIARADILAVAPHDHVNRCDAIAITWVIPIE